MAAVSPAVSRAGARVSGPIVTRVRRIPVDKGEDLIVSDVAVPAGASLEDLDRRLVTVAAMRDTIIALQLEAGRLDLDVTALELDQVDDRLYEATELLRRQRAALIGRRRAGARLEQVRYAPGRGITAW